MTTLEVGVVVVFALIVLGGAGAMVHAAAGRLERANRKVRLLHLWARERRADLALLVAAFIRTVELERLREIEDGDNSETWKTFEQKLKRQARYVGLEWTDVPTPAYGFMEPEKLTMTELKELLDLTSEIRLPGRFL